MRPADHWKGAVARPVVDRLFEWLDRRALPVLKKTEKTAGYLSTRLLYRFASAAPPREPVFVIGGPRTGTTILFRLLASSPSLSALPWETNTLWGRVHALNGVERYARGDVLTEFDATPRVREFVHRCFNLYYRTGRALEKSARNALRICFLNVLFPDAKYVFLYRRGEEAVNSMLNAARPEFATRFPPYKGTKSVWIEGAPRPGWHFTMPPDWRELCSRPFPEACARIWVETTEAMLRDRAVPPAGSVCDVDYDSLVADPVGTAERLCQFLGLTLSPETVAFANRFAPVNYTSLPRRNKWRAEHPREVESILPVIEETMGKLGYASPHARPLIPKPNAEPIPSLANQC